MKRNIIVAVFMAAFMWINAQEKSAINIIPLPQQVSVSEKMLSASVIKTISAEPSLANEAKAAQEGLKQYANVSSKIVTKKGHLQLALDKTLGEEAYQLVVKPKKVIVKGGSARGVFYGIQTLLQEFNAYGAQAKCGTVSDCPRFKWRGFMLDESRHFFGMAQVKQTLDMMAFYKLNKFHWHLTDSPGWRIEIKSYPNLTIEGAKGCHTDKKAPAQFYTQEQIREIVKYAADRHIDIIPEIDMPGHARAATRSYPELAVEPGSFTYNPAKEEVYTFIEKVLKEVASLFPYEYIHIGGDEVSLGNKMWDTDEAIQGLIKRENLGDKKGAEAYFHKRIAPVIKSLGKKMTTWDDVLEIGAGHLGTTITWWRHDRLDHLTDALKDGYEMILCPRLPLYFDFVQDASHDAGRKWYKNGEHNPISDVYAFPESLYAKWDGDANLKKGIMGFQANLWTEVVKNQNRREFMTYPRLCALAEAAWTNADLKNFDSFSVRLEPAYKLFDRLGIFYCDYRNMKKQVEPKL